MCKNSVIKKLAFLAFIGAAIGGLVIFLKKFEKDDDELSANEEDSCDSCSSSDACRSYTTLSGDASAAQDEPSEGSSEEETLEEENAEKETVEKETVDETKQETESNTEAV